MPSRAIGFAALIVIALGAAITWFMGNFLYSLLWGWPDQWHVREADLIAYTLAHITPFILSLLIVTGGFFLLRWEMRREAGDSSTTAAPARRTEAMRRVVIESPYAGNIERNVEYARRAMKDSLSRNEAPFAGHLLYTQVLDDLIPLERDCGIAAHMVWIESAEVIVVYEDYGISTGMKLAIVFADKCVPPIPVEYRKIGENP